MYDLLDRMAQQQCSDFTNKSWGTNSSFNTELKRDIMNDSTKEPTSVDFATGRAINANKPEELVRQSFEKILVNDYEYKKEQLDIEVTIQMGSSRKRADIGIYDSPKKESLIGIVETKAKDKEKGHEQLISYMSATNTCKFGIWTNGDATNVFIRTEDGSIEELKTAQIPVAGKIGNVIKSYENLKPASNLKAIFKNINSHLRTEGKNSIAAERGEEILKMIFCKLVDETESKEEKSTPEFQIFDKEKAAEVGKRIKALFDKTKNHHKFLNIFKPRDSIELENDIIVYVVGQLQIYTLFETNSDVVGEAFQIFAEKQHAGDNGQFFTPRPLVNALVKMIDIQKADTVMDTACGSGGFLLSALEVITKDSSDQATKMSKAQAQIFGIDVDPRLVKLGKAYMSIMGDGKSNIVEADSLKHDSLWNGTAREVLIDKNSDDGGIRKVDKILSNPPFGTKTEVQIKDKEILKQYDLGRKWKKISGTNTWEKTDRIKPTPKQILFIENNIVRFLKKGGQMAIVLPDGILGNPTYGYIRQWIQEKTIIKAIIDCPTKTFAPYTMVKTSVLILEKKKTGFETQGPIFMAVVKDCGQTNRGAEIRDKEGELIEDFSIIAENYINSDKIKTDERLGFWIEAIEKNTFNPKIYNVEKKKEANNLIKQKPYKYEVKTFKDLQEESMIKITGIGDTPDSTEYDDDGELRFIRTSDISFMMLEPNPNQRISKETFLKYKDKQDLKIGDIIMVKDGDNKVGDFAIIHDEEDRNCLIQSHFKKIRCTGIDPYLMLYFLNAKETKIQIQQRVLSQGTLSTIGERLDDIKIAFPTEKMQRIELAKKAKKYMDMRKQTIRDMNELV